MVTLPEPVEKNEVEIEQEIYSKNTAVFVHNMV